MRAATPTQNDAGGLWVAGTERYAGVSRGPTVQRVTPRGLSIEQLPLCVRYVLDCLELNLVKFLVSEFRQYV
jgi:hypothetical protein